MSPLSHFWAREPIRRVFDAMPAGEAGLAALLAALRIKSVCVTDSVSSADVHVPDVC